MEFFRVQIPYRGIIPLLQRKGPVAMVELTRDQIMQLKDYKVELLDPDTGKSFRFPEEQPVKITLDDFANARPITKDEAKKIINEKMVEEKVEKVETPATSDDHEEVVMVDVRVTPQNQDSIPVTSASIEEPISDEEVDAEVSIEKTATSGIPEFNYERIKGYSNLPRKKKKELRAYYAEAVKESISEEDLNKVYEVLNTMVATQE